MTPSFLSGLTQRCRGTKKKTKKKQQHPTSLHTTITKSLCREYPRTWRCVWMMRSWTPMRSAPSVCPCWRMERMSGTTICLSFAFSKRKCWQPRCEHELCVQFVVSWEHICFPFLVLVTAFVGPFNKDWNISTTIELIAMKLCADIHGTIFFFFPTCKSLQDNIHTWHLSRWKCLENKYNSHKLKKTNFCKCN